MPPTSIEYEPRRARKPVFWGPATLLGVPLLTPGLTILLWYCWMLADPIGPIPLRFVLIGLQALILLLWPTWLVVAVQDLHLRVIFPGVAWGTVILFSALNDEPLRMVLRLWLG